MEALLAQAVLLQGKPPPHFNMIWCNPQFGWQGLEGIIRTTKWLLGEAEVSPMDNDVLLQPLPTLREIGHQEGLAHRHVWGEGNRNINEWYAAAVNRTVHWVLRDSEDWPRPLDTYSYP